MLEIEPQKTRHPVPWGPNKLACGYLDLVVLHSAALFKILGAAFSRKSWSPRILARPGRQNLGALLGMTAQCSVRSKR